MRMLKNIFNFMFSRFFLVVLMLILQIGLLVTLLVYFSESVFYLYLSLNVLSFLAAIAVVSNHENPSYKLTWIIAILTFPLTGGMFYLLFGNKRMPKKLKKRISNSLADTKRHMPTNELADEKLLPLGYDKLNQSHYIYNTAGAPVFEHTSSEYYPVGEVMNESILRELKQAKKYIFLEFFIIRPGIMWDGIFDVLKQKITEGVEVYLIYDDIGCISSMPKGYDKVIRAAGIKLCVFNPFRPRVSVILNYRDHRKIIVIDGKTAFCGGINIADEYINVIERFGHWKDTGVMLKGDAVWQLAFMFLQMWQFQTDQFIDFEKYKAESGATPSDGFVQPFGDSPLDKFNTTETAYLNIIYRAKRYVYITTPYLVIDSEMECALCSAAQAGVDVRIITPHIYDKWYVHLLTRSHYPQLIKAGVRVYEYEPGFMHGKMYVSDDEICMVGTCNMDFRSFYLHFECGVMFYAAKVIEDVKRDILNCQRICHEVTLEDTNQIPIYMRVVRSVLKLFAPLL